MPQASSFLYPSDAFEMFDADGSGGIDEDEFVFCLGAWGEGKSVLCYERGILRKSVTPLVWCSEYLGLKLEDCEMPAQR